MLFSGSPGSGPQTRDPQRLTLPEALSLVVPMLRPLDPKPYQLIAPIVVLIVPMMVLLLTLTLIYSP